VLLLLLLLFGAVVFVFYHQVSLLLVGGREEREIFIWRRKKGTRMHERGEIGEKLSAGGGTALSMNDNSLF